MGVRLAIGASPASIFLMTLARGARLLVAGIVLGLIGAVFAARLLAGYVWQATTFDLLTFAAVSAVLLLAGMQACALPARRASKISPMTALRQE
jgi:putative ABC transport system permease protein